MVNKKKKTNKFIIGLVMLIVMLTASMSDSNSKALAANPESDFTFTVNSTGSIISSYVGISKDVIIPDTLGGKPVTEISNSSFSNKTLTSVIIPATVTKIGDSAFSYNSFSNVTLPASLVDLGSSSFAENKLTSINIPAGVTELKYYTFQSNKLTNVVIPSTVKSIGGNAFEYNELTSVTLNEGIQTINDNAFRYNKLSDVTFPSTITQIYGRSALLGNQATPSNLIIRGYDSAAKVKGLADLEGYTYVSLGATYAPPIVPPSAGSTQSHNATAVFTGGDLLLQIPQINTFGQIKLTSQAKLVNTSFDNTFNVIDSRGTDEGWRLDVTASQFTETTPAGGFQSGTSATILPVGSLSLSPLSNITRVGPGAGTLPIGKLAVNTIIDDGTVTVAGANLGEGSGEFDLTFGTNSLSLAVDPATAKIDKINYPGVDTPYASTLTWTLVSAP